MAALGSREVVASLRGVIRGFSKEAKTRVFPSPSFGGFGYIVAVTKYISRLPECLFGNVIGTYSSVGNVGIGLRLCDNESVFMTDRTAHHDDFCWCLGDARYSHMRAHLYALNGTFLADSSEILSRALQFPVAMNKTSIQEKLHTYEKASFRRYYFPRACSTGT